MTSSAPLQLAVVGCGDFLRWQLPQLQSATATRVRTLFDLDPSRAARFAGPLGAAVTTNLDDIYADPAIDLVALFVPPWARRDALVRAAAAGKHVITTKPFGPDVASCAAMIDAVEAAGVQAAVIYNRTGDDTINTLKHLFDHGELGRLSLYKQDWVHHYPAWNTWALDPARNGGPFMDAMIHNLNTARFLMGRPATRATFFSDNHAHPDLACRDTEFMKLDFAAGGAAHLFITWAADLAVYSLDGNDREHHDHTFMVTDRGWHLRRTRHHDRDALEATRHGETRLLPLRRAGFNPYDAFAATVRGETPLATDLVSLRMAAEDIALIRGAEAQPGQRHPVSLAS